MSDETPNITSSVLNEHMDVLATDVVERYEARLIDGAKRYAGYDRSDPFTLDRCMGHIRQGLCKPINPFREEVDEDGNKRHIPTGLPWYWNETIYETIKLPSGRMDIRETKRKRPCRTEIIGDAGAPGHYDAMVFVHKNLRRT